MNVVARQSIKYSLVGYFGFLLGTFSAIAVFPLDMDFYGKMRYVLSAAEIVLPFVVFGLSYASQRFYFFAQKEGREQNLLSLSLAMIVLNFSIFVLLYFIINSAFPNLKTWNVFRDFWHYRYLILPLVLFLAVSQLYNRYLSNYKRIVVPNIFENIFPKVGTLGAFLLFIFAGFREPQALWFFVGVYFLAMLGYMVYLKKLEARPLDFSLGFVQKDHLWRKILDYGFFALLGNVGSYLSFRIAGYLIPGYLSFEDNGVYGIILAITSVLTIPQMGLTNIATPIVNAQMEEQRFAELERFHQSTSLVLVYSGMILFACVVAGYPYLTALMKNGDLLLAAEPVLWMIGIGLLADLATGFNSQIISMSKYYRINIVLTLLLAVVNVGLIFYFLKYTDWGLTGVALATTISLVLYNLAKVIFNWVKFKVHPFSLKMLYALVVSVLALFVALVLPEFSQAWLNLIYKPLVVLLVVLSGNALLKIVPLKQFFDKKNLKF